MLNYGINSQILRIINRNRIEIIDNLTILINKQTFDCDVIEITPKYIYFVIENIGLIQPNKTTKYEYILTADETIIDKGYIQIN